MSFYFAFGHIYNPKWASHIHGDKKKCLERTNSVDQSEFIQYLETIPGLSTSFPQVVCPWLSRAAHPDLLLKESRVGARLPQIPVLGIRELLNSPGFPVSKHESLLSLEVAAVSDA